MCVCFCEVILFFVFFTKIQDKEAIRLLQERLVASEQKASEQRNKVQSLQQELKVAHKVELLRLFAVLQPDLGLSSTFKETCLWQVVMGEVGKDIPFKKLMNSPVGFKGRAQQIQTLQLKVS